MSKYKAAYICGACGKRIKLQDEFLETLLSLELSNPQMHMSFHAVCSCRKISEKSRITFKALCAPGAWRMVYGLIK